MLTGMLRHADADRRMLRCCGGTLAPIDSDGDIEILKCLVHGVFHLGPNMDVTPGLPVVSSPDTRTPIKPVT